MIYEYNRSGWYDKNPWILLIDLSELNIVSLESQTQQE